MKNSYTSHDLFYFVRRGKLPGVLRALYFNPELVTVKNVWGHDALYYARISGKKRVIEAIEGLLKEKGQQPLPPVSKKALPTLGSEEPESSDSYHAFEDDDDDEAYPEAEIKAESELEDNMILMASMFPALSLSIIEDVLKRSKNDVQAGIDFLLAEDAQKPLIKEEKRLISLPLGNEDEFPALTSPRTSGKAAQPSYQKPLKENLQLLPQAESPLTPRQKKAADEKEKGKGKGKEEQEVSTPQDEEAEELASWQSSGEEEGQWVDIEGQEPEGEELDFEDNVSFAEGSGLDWDVVSQSSEYSFQLEPEVEPVVEVRQESGKSDRILDTEVEEEAGPQPSSFADALKQNLSCNHVPLRPTNRALLPKSSFVTTPVEQRSAKAHEEEDEVLAKDPFRPYGSAQKPRKSGKSQYKPKTKGGKGKQSKSYL